jgi:thiosulfate/3-mercaptopyruvate sulfurtransferase
MEALHHMSDYANPDSLASTDWVSQHLSDGSIKLVEVDEDTDAYQRGHISGAGSLHWRDELQDAVIRDFVSKEKFEKLLSGKGIGNDDQVVLYGGNNNWFAAYAYWYFKLYGHDNVRLMNGGRKKWELEGRELTAEKPAVSATSYTAQAPNTSIRALRDEVISKVGNTPMVDVRSPDEFSGKLSAPAHLPQEQAQRKGHIPSAKNVPWSKAANEDGTFKSLEDLQRLYVEEQGLDSGTETIAYCRIGERSSHTWFVLQELLGFKKVKNYDGSWTEYGSLVGVPIEKEYVEEGAAS